ncbi:MAG: hypothetical protein JWN95_2237 [Frankiales bacterium]|nr:hypothetical protein [Frankiales bacterium]
MAVWNAPSEPSDALDLRLALRGFVTLFHRMQILDEATGWLRAHGYRVLVADAGSWSDSAAMHADLATLLELPDYYGANLDALNDGLGSLVTPPVGADSTAGPAASGRRETASEIGIVLVLLRFDAFVRREPSTAHALTDIIAQQARIAAIFGVRLLGLLQSDDPALELPDVGATPVSWTDLGPPGTEPAHPTRTQQGH